MVIKLIIALILSLLSSLAYRAGGMSKEATALPKWIPVWLRKSWVRDWLCPACVYGALLLFWQPSVWWGWLLLIPSYGLLGGALSTYWDKLFGFDNLWFAGFMCGLASLPLAFCGFAWWLVLLRAIFLAVSWGLLNKYEHTDYKEEMLRGFFLVI